MTQELVISSGDGPDEVKRFVSLLARRMIELCQECRLRVVSIREHGPHGTPRSVVIRIAGAGTTRLSAELGTHALICRSKTRGLKGRKRWYASVHLRPLRDDDPVEEIRPGDLEVTTFRCSGPGGQHLNKTCSGVRIHHRPTGITIRVTDERDQHANRRIAMERLQAAIENRKKELAMKEREQTWRHHHGLERGNPVRVYHLDARGRLEEKRERSS